MMADADSKLTGKPGIVLVSRAPGVTNGSAGLHIARQDATPLVMFVGQVSRGTIEREARRREDASMMRSWAEWKVRADQMNIALKALVAQGQRLPFAAREAEQQLAAVRKSFESQIDELRRSE